MTTATLTSKGQLTIPKEIRDLLHLHSGDKIGFFLKNNNEVTLRPMTKSIDEVFGRLYRKDRAPKTLDEIKSALQLRMKRL